MEKRNTTLRAVRRALLLVSAALPPAPVMLAVVPAAAQDATGLANPGAGDFMGLEGALGGAGGGGGEGPQLVTCSVPDNSGYARKPILRPRRGRAIRPNPLLHHDFTNPTFERYGPNGPPSSP